MNSATLTWQNFWIMMPVIMAAQGMCKNGTDKYINQIPAEMIYKELHFAEQFITLEEYVSM